MFNQPDGGDREAEKQNLVMKTVIALQGRSNTGKTETLNWLIDKLVEHGMAVTEQDSAASDRLAIGSYRKVNVGVVTQGDPGGKMKEWLDRCMAAECAVIVCACRSKGSHLTISMRRPSPTATSRFGPPHISAIGEACAAASILTRFAPRACCISSTV